MGFLGKAIAGMIIAVGSEIVVKTVLPAAIKKGKKILKEMEEKAQKKGE